MIWLLTIPIIVYFTFCNLYASGFPGFYPEHHRNFLEWCGLIFASGLFSVLISLVPMGIGIAIGSGFETIAVEDEEYPLVALRQQDGFKGRSYFLGAGMIQDQQYYFWYRKHGDGISGGKTIREPGVNIYEDNENPRMVTFRSEYRSKWIEKYGWIIGIDTLEDDKWCPEFYIPAGSIREEIQL